MSGHLSKPVSLPLLAVRREKDVLMFKEGILDSVQKRINHAATA